MKIKNMDSLSPYESSRPTEIGIVKNLFNPEEISKIKEDLEILPYDQAFTNKTFYQGEWEKDQWRKSKIKWVPQDQIFEWIYSKIFNCVNTLNSQAWKYDIRNFQDKAQYTEYPANINGNYNWHIDLGDERSSHRKLSVSLQLSSNLDYQGGDLELYRGGESNDIGDREIGSAIIFPSFLLHRVTPVTKGIRKSLVFWIGGPPFK